MGNETEGLTPDQGIALYPPPLAVQGQDLGKVSHRPVPIIELHGFFDEVATKLKR